MHHIPRLRTVALALITALLGATLSVGIAAPATAAPVGSLLADLTITPGSFDAPFDPAGDTFSASVPFETTSLQFTPTVDDPSTTISTWNGNVSAASASGVPVSAALRPGLNILTVTVTAVDSSPKQYTLMITRLPAPPPLYNLDLASLAITPGDLEPEFSSEIPSYTVNVGYEVASMTFTPGSVEGGNTVSITATTSVTGNTVPLAASGTAVFITVTAPDSTFKQYVITVNRGPAPTADVELGSLSVTHGTLTPAFESDVLDYTVSVPYAARFVDIAAAASASSDPHTLTINNAPLVDGVLTVPVNYDSIGSSYAITLQPTNGANAKTYIVTVTREAPSNNADLTDLSLSAGTLTPVFSNAETDYTVTVPYLTTSTTVTSTAADATAIIRVNHQDTASGAASSPIALSVGTTSITVEVTAEDGVTTTTRTIAVTREAPDLDLDTLTVTGGNLSPTFDAGTTAYSLALPYVTSTVDVAALAVESDWVVEIDGVETDASTIAVPVGASTITVKITALYGEYREYTIDVTRAAARAADVDLGLGFAAGDKLADATFDLHGENLLPGSTATVTMYSSPVVLATGTVLGGGTIALSGSLPANTSPGAHRLVFTGVAEDGSAVAITAWFTVLRNGTIGAVSLTGPVAYLDALVLTGADSGPLSILGALLLLTGAGALTARRLHLRRA